MRPIRHDEKLFKSGTLCKESPGVGTKMIFMILGPDKENDDGYAYQIIIVDPGIFHPNEAGTIQNNFLIYTDTEILFEA